MLLLLARTFYLLGNKLVYKPSDGIKLSTKVIRHKWYADLISENANYKIYLKIKQTDAKEKN